MLSQRAFRRKIMKSKKMENPQERLLMFCIMHFGDQDPRAISCETCLDFTQGHCPGEGFRGDDCLRCMMEHSKNAVMVSGF